MIVRETITINKESQLRSFMEKYGYRIDLSLKVEICDDPSVKFEMFGPQGRKDATLIYPTTIALGLKLFINPLIQ